MLNEFRATGMRVKFILMDTDTYLRCRRYGAEYDRRGRSLTVRPPRDVPHLRPAERELHDHGTDSAPRRGVSPGVGVDRRGRWSAVPYLRMMNARRHGAAIMLGPLSA